MSYIKINPNPCKKIVGDCVIRAVSIAENVKWQDAYLALCMQGLEMCDMPSSNAVWKAYLRRKGYISYPVIGDFTVRQFANTHKYGVYVVCTGGHVVAVIDGSYYDSWNSGDEQVTFYMVKENNI